MGDATKPCHWLGEHRLEALTPELIARVERELLIQTPLRKADLLFVFGTRHGIPQFLWVIEGLWRRDLFSFAIISGGPTLEDPRTEAEVLADGMVDFGFPAERLILEQRATNTGENVILSLPLIEERLGLANVKSLIAVGKFYTAARYLMTLERHWPAVEKMIAPVHFPPYVASQWHADPLSREKVLGEWRKLERYLEAGYIAPWAPATDG